MLLHGWPGVATSHLLAARLLLPLKACLLANLVLILQPLVTEESSPLRLLCRLADQMLLHHYLPATRLLLRLPG